MRNPSVSIAKGIAIILMVAAHARCGIWWQQYINMFHMPLFLFMSGYCFRESHLADAKGFVSKRIKAIWWPFVKWQLIFLVLHNVFFVLNIYNGEYGFRGIVSHEYGIGETVKNAFYIVTTMTHGEQLLGGFWFLKSLLVGALLFYCIFKITLYIYREREGGITKADYIVGAFLLGITLVFNILGEFIPKTIMETNDLMAGFFIWSGYFYCKKRIEIDKCWWFIVVAALLVAISTEFLPGKIQHIISMRHITLSLIIPYMITALIGSMMVFGISRHLAECDNWLKKMLVFVGNNTLDILTWHFLSFKLISLLLIWIYGFDCKRLAEFPVIENFAYQGWWVVYLIVGVVVPLLVSLISINKPKSIAQNC